MNVSITALRERFNEMVVDHNGSFRANGVGPIGADENSQVYDAIVNDIVSHLQEPLPVRSVLEVGCGTGEIMRRLKRVVKGVQGVDVSDRMVDVCRKQGLDADLVTEKLPFPDRSFDAVLMYSVLINIDDAALLDSMIDEAFRVTKEDGIVFLGNVPNADHLDFLEHQPLTTGQRMKRFAKWILGRNSHPLQIRYFAYRPAQFLKYCDKFDVRKFVLKRSLLSETGLQKIDIVYDRAGISRELDAVDREPAPQ